MRSGQRRFLGAVKSGHAILLAAVLGTVAGAQSSWQIANTPANGEGTYCYDSHRRVMVFTSVFGSTYESDMTGGWRWLPVVSPGPRSVLFSGVAYHKTRQRVVLHDNLTTWEWGGTSWVSRASIPPDYDYLFLVGHERRGTVLAFGGPANPWTANDLYEWNGTTWNLVPATNKPPRPGDFNASRIYLSCAYDARRDKVVLFGSAWFDWTRQQFSNPQPDVWEWDSSNGWINRTVQGTVDYSCVMYFDSQRGVLTRVQGAPAQMAEWDGGNAWVAVTPLGGSPNAYVERHGAFHAERGVFMVGTTSAAARIGYHYGTVSPAAFESLAAGCPGTLGSPGLALTHNWTRAWMGRTLSVDLTNLPQSTGFLAIGWSDQQAGSFQLPLDLAPFGMPGCHARVATDLIVPLTGANNAATWTTPVPQNNALLGVSFYQQGFAIDPAANAAGLTASNSVRVTIGRL